MQTANQIADQLRAIVGAARVIEDPATLDLFSQDIWRRASFQAALVVKPQTTEELAAVAATAHATGCALAPRGGGMSYTSAYTPAAKGTISLDLSGMNRVLDINAEDMVVTVQAGCTWKQLNDALKPHGLRTPFWGPFSGLISTIGGGLSQQNAMFGAGHYGPPSESVVALTVVLSDGRVLRTGAAGSALGAPFFKHYGPDLAGLFCGDSGALGIKAEVTLRLMRAPAHEAHLSFAFKSSADLFAAMAAVARSSLASELCAFDPNLVRIRMKRASLSADMKALQSVVGAEKSLVKGLASAARVVMAGRSFLEEDDYPLHVICEGRSDAAVEADAAEVRRVATNANGREIENTIAKLMRADPFPALNSMLGPNGERWAPVHGIVPLSQARVAHEKIEAIFAKMQDAFEKNGIFTAYLFTSLSTNAIVIEPVFYWPDARLPVHEASIEPAHLAKLENFSSNPAAAEVVASARAQIVDMFSSLGAGHLQIGRTYRYRESLSAEARGLLDAIKFYLDPTGAINPGCLGLDPDNRTAGD